MLFRAQMKSSEIWSLPLVRPAFLCFVWTRQNLHLFFEWQTSFQKICSFNAVFSRHIFEEITGTRAHSHDWRLKPHRLLWVLRRQPEFVCRQFSVSYPSEYFCSGYKHSSFTLFRQAENCRAINKLSPVWMNEKSIANNNWLRLVGYKVVRQFRGSRWHFFSRLALEHRVT